MRYPSERTLRRARKIAACWLKARTVTLPPMLSDLSVAVDAGLRDRGRRTPLFDSLFAYEAVLPDTHASLWLTHKRDAQAYGCGNGVACVVSRSSPVMRTYEKKDPRIPDAAYYD